MRMAIVLTFMLFALSASAQVIGGQIKGGQNSAGGGGGGGGMCAGALDLSAGCPLPMLGGF